MFTPGYSSQSLAGLPAGISASQFDDMLKSLASTAPVGNTATGGGAIQFESAEAVLKNISFSNKQLVLLRWLRANGLVQPAQALLHQWIQIRNTYNPHQDVATGSLTPGVDRAVDLQRLSTQIRLFNAKGSYEYLLQMVGANVAQMPGGGAGQTPRDIAYQAAALQLQFGLTRDLYFGDSAINVNEPDGFLKQIESAGTADLQIVDLRGGRLTADRVKASVAKLFSVAFGAPDTLFCDPLLRQSLSRDETVRGRFGTGQGGNIIIGNNADSIVTEAGSVKLVGDVMLTANRFPVPTASLGDSPPSTPVMSAQPSAAGSAGLFSADDAATYRYKIVAYNAAAGHSIAVETNTVAVAATNTVSMTIDTPSGVTVTYYRVWRKKGSGEYQFLKRVVYGGTTTAFTDTNSIIAGTTQALCVQTSPSHIAFAQLTNGMIQNEGAARPVAGDMLRVDFGVSAFKQDFAMVMQGAPYMAIPTQGIKFINCAPTPVDEVA